MNQERSSALILGGLLVVACVATSVVSNGTNGSPFFETENSVQEPVKGPKSSTIRNRTQILSPTQSNYPTFRDQMNLRAQEMGLPVSNPEELSRQIQVEAEQLIPSQLAELKNIALDSNAGADLRYLAVYYLTYAKPEAMPLLQGIATSKHPLLGKKLESKHQSSESFRQQDETALRLMALAGIEKHILKSESGAQIPRDFVEQLPTDYLKKIGRMLLRSQSTQKPVIENMISQTTESEIL